jgi:hypothetical protein
MHELMADAADWYTEEEAMAYAACCQYLVIEGELIELTYPDSSENPF